VSPGNLSGSGAQAAAMPDLEEAGEFDELA
jgi:hypothetical protein